MKPRRYKIARPYTELGNLLQSSRVKAKLTQRQVSLKLGYSSAQFISNFERGLAMPPLKKLRIIVKTYRLDPIVIVDHAIAVRRKEILETLSA